ncbi:aminoglycoside phosphotransferase family protein [Kribbella sp. NPDC051587]|uniref:aminoglycoside phosphotransferase family protein n=1 Tax=Kribbella sp. NPDC051587 TaxID=3364119 RepID=UPI0037A2792C
METKTVVAVVTVGDRYVGTSLPFEADRVWWPEIEDATAQLDALLGVRTVVLRLVHTGERQNGRGGLSVYHVQADREPAPGVLDATPNEWSEGLTRPEPRRASWAEVDGPRRMIEWASEILGTSDWVQVKTWNLSCLIRFDGAWAKATSTFCSVDADVIRQVQQYDAQLGPAVLGVDLERRWSLLAHAPGSDCWEPDAETVDNVLTRWVAVQAALPTADLGTPRLLPNELAGHLTRLLAGEAGVQLNATEHAQARELVDQLPGIVAELDESGLPITLVHGDFHPGNWRSDGTTRMIVDWADAFVGHPAADVRRLYDWLPTEKREHAATVWAAAWKHHLPASDPLRALAPMAVVQALYGAVLYQKFLDHIEPSERVYHATDPAAGIRAACVAAGNL